jgi:hypothetical protein
VALVEGRLHQSDLRASEQGWVARWKTSFAGFYVALQKSSGHGFQIGIA